MSSSEPPPMQPGQPSMIGKTRTASSSNRQDPLTGRDASSAGVALQNMLAACAAILLLAGCAATRPAVPDAASTAREVLLTIRQRQTASMGLTGPLDSRYLRRRGYGAAPPEIARVLDQLGKEHGIERKEGWPIRSLAVYCEVFVVPAGRDVDEILARLRTDPRIETAQPMHLFETLASRYDDPYADLQPAALELGIEQAHQLATGKGVRVAVIDSAVDATHPELVGRIGLARDLVEPRGRGVRAEVHGTAVAGVIASAANNREGIVGIAPDVDIASLRACWTHPTDPGQARCSSFTLAQALEIAIDIEPDVINLSLAGPPDPLLERLLDKAAARGIVIVAAAPPVGAAPASFPSSHRAVLVAWSSTAMGAARVPHGLPAPADEIMTTIPGAGYAIFSGTSLAAAHLSGVIALLRERSPALEAGRIADVLRRTVVWHDRRASVNACFALEAVAEINLCEPRIKTAAQ